MDDSRTPPSAIESTEGSTHQKPESSSYFKTLENASLDQKDDSHSETEGMKMMDTCHNETVKQNMCTSRKLTEIPVPIYVSSKAFVEDNTEDDGSVSSLESCDESTIKGPRSIFGDYWKHSIDEEVPMNKESTSSGSRTEKTSSSLTLSTSCSQDEVDAAIQLPDEFEYQEFKRDFSKNSKHTCDRYEEILKNNEIGRTSMPQSTYLKDATEVETLPQQAEKCVSPTPHRTLFKNKYSTSSPSFSYGYRQPIDVAVRKASSASSLQKRSCLRSRTRSLSVDSTAIESEQSSSSRPSVSFDARVSVHEYEKPHDRYTGDGWSKWFAYRL